MTRPNRGSDALAEAADQRSVVEPVGREPVAENCRFAERRLKGSKPEAMRQKGATLAFLLSMFGRQSDKRKYTRRPIRGVRSFATVGPTEVKRSAALFDLDQRRLLLPGRTRSAHDQYLL